jgi:poly-beta-1,6-N-acetyl-D-glucosamine synthase
MPRLDVSYVIITPVRDEEKYIEHTLRSVISQSTKPAEWVIVNDGSADGTGEIIERYASEHPWIRTVHRKDRGFRKSGGGVIEAFYEGLKSLRAKEWEYIVKLDGDLLLGETYFERCLEEFQANPKLGIGGGTILSNVNGTYILEPVPSFHVRGATKIYRRECWEAIGELIRAPGWDTLDEVKANMKGWETRCFPDIELYQQRPTGGPSGAWNDNVKNGLANYVSGYHPVFMLGKCARRILRKPMLLGSAGLFYGFLKGYAKRIPQVADEELIRYLRAQQMNRLLLRPSIWR